MSNFLKLPIDAVAVLLVVLVSTIVLLYALLKISAHVMARVGPSQMRKLVTREQPAQVLVIGGIPGKPYVPPEFTEVGASPASASKA